MLSQTAARITPETLQFKRYDSGTLSLDRYRTTKPLRGCVAFLHGGALLLGSRKDLPEPVIALLLKQGFDVASLDYRVLSEASFQEIHKDVRDGCRFVRTLYPSTPLFLVGYSAGAYLSLACGTGERLVDGICAFAGYGDLGAQWYREPSAFFVSYKDVSHVGPRLAAGASFSSFDERVDLYVHLRQTGTWPIYALGKTFSEARLREFSPLHHLTERYPPTVLIHGTEDCDVPHSASVDMASSLQQASVPHRFISMEGMDHDLYSKVELPKVQSAWLEALEFLASRGS